LFLVWIKRRFWARPMTPFSRWHLHPADGAMFFFHLQLCLLQCHRLSRWHLHPADGAMLFFHLQLPLYLIQCSVTSAKTYRTDHTTSMWHIFVPKTAYRMLCLLMFWQWTSLDTEISPFYRTQYNKHSHLKMRADPVVETYWLRFQYIEIWIECIKATVRNVMLGMLILAIMGHAECGL
jgi:hypothetical protein